MMKQTHIHLPSKAAVDLICILLFFGWLWEDGLALHIPCLYSSSRPVKARMDMVWLQGMWEQQAGWEQRRKISGHGEGPGSSAPPLLGAACSPPSHTPHSHIDFLDIPDLLRRNGGGLTLVADACPGSCHWRLRRFICALYPFWNLAGYKLEINKNRFISTFQVYIRFRGDNGNSSLSPLVQGSGCM